MHPIIFHTRKIRNKLVCPNIVVARLPKVPTTEMIDMAQANIREIVLSILVIENHAI